jgi:hypothetical protein
MTPLTASARMIACAIEIEICRLPSWDGGAWFVFEGATRRRERALEYLHLPRIKPQCFNGVEALRYE